MLEYESKIISLDKALSLVQSDFQIVTGLGAAEGKLFLSSLHTLAGRVKNVTLTNCLPMADLPLYKAEYKDSFNIDGWFYTPLLRAAHKNGNTSFIPGHLHSSAYKRLDHIHPNIYVGSATMPDKHGYVSLSISNTYEKRMIEAADIVILEINPHMPYTYGDVELHVRDVDYMIKADYDVPVLPDLPFTEKDAVIGKYISDLVHDGDCIQLGIGGIPNAVARGLENKNDLGVHTELLTSGIMKLANMGVVNGSKKQVDRGKMVATMVLGTPELYEFVDHNPAVQIRDGAEVNDPYVISRNDNQVSINTTLEVDLTGQCCSESLGSMQFSGTGGQADTAIGAQMSKNGRSIIALYSTAMVKDPKTGVRHEVSKIVPQLKAGAAVSLSRNDVDYLVTEYGVAQLKGTNLRERVEILSSIAHPDFRDELKRQALELGIIYKR
ncbi:acetyl-CoA hydrolase/transferase family protein [Papillibacter cinnamivorans]|uniref:Acyl-CoA hydrolase n=1 Tax=Papillibacter cinnamivorans DSM 12816 TaxID=1122930 RepID=A0A1W1YVC0_9FIRM|nr:acetyl-CoA hydrolase/transferase C-terminal domain-containing protein [Papillibacter cinnamivorans]SMC40053.1 Acyl-CoA hydrolase [Papillibacter cinnamivorans DSM 12816]